MAPKAKTASKNSPTNRGSAILFCYKYKDSTGKDIQVNVVPAKYISDFFSKPCRNSMVMENKDTRSLILDENGHPLPWTKAVKLK